MLCHYCVGHDARTNLAIESALFLEPNPTPILLVYRCRPVIVIGRHQNPWNEIDLAYARRHRIEVLRRESGGGTVYHDLGNINFSFILPQASHSIQNNLTIVIRALHRMGIRARIGDHNDILVGGKKISGSAFRHKGGRALHHGTLLCHANLSRLRNSLRPAGIVKSGIIIHSRPSSVANMRHYAPANMRRVLEALSRELSRGAYFPPAAATDHAAPPRPFTPIDTGSLTADQRALFDSAYLRLGSWEWRVAKTPPAHFSLARRHCYLQFQVVEGRMKHVMVHCDHPRQRRIQQLCAAHLADLALNRQAFSRVRTLFVALRPIIGARHRAYHSFRALFRELIKICRI